MIEITPLGAGQDVGRSCILITLNQTKNVIVDCGMHMGYEDIRRFPDFSFISQTGNYTHLIDCVVITHFHLDHCGSLPYFTEMCGYDGPVYMSEPTRAISRLLLEDYRKISVERKGETNFFTSQDIKNCFKKVKILKLHQRIEVCPDLFITAYYAGHVLGAVMVLIESGGSSVLYTGDYNMTADRHLGPAFIERVQPDVLITESTYATTIRDSKKARETDFLKKVHECVLAGGKVLIPVFALGRAQELCILIESYWERMNLNIPVYFSAGMTQKANHYYRMYIDWTNEKLKKTFFQRNMFDFKHIQPFDMSYADQPGTQVLFASPGMLHAGFSLEVFKKWAPDPKNMVILPGYCVPGTVGARVLAGEKLIELDQRTTIDVKLQIQHLSFSAHADMKGILQLIRQCDPKFVVLVHGEPQKMKTLSDHIKLEFNLNCFFPANASTLTIENQPKIPVQVSNQLYNQYLNETIFNRFKYLQRDFAMEKIQPLSELEMSGYLVSDGKQLEILNFDEFKARVSSESPALLISFAKVYKARAKYNSLKEIIVAKFQEQKVFSHYENETIYCQSIKIEFIENLEQNEYSFKVSLRLKDWLFFNDIWSQISF